MAFHVGDLETYHYACYLFVRELAHLAVKLRAGAYFSAHYPWHSMEPPSGPAFLTRVTEAGWQLSLSPRSGRLKDLAERWAGFSDPDLARFLVEHASAAVRADLEQLEAAGDATAEEVRSMPSLLLLGSLLRNDSLDTLAARRKAGARDDPRRLADALAILRAASETQLTELISAEGASPFAAGAERDVPPPKTELIQAIEIVSPDPNGAETFWPRVSWLNWRAPSGAPWNFGHVSAGSDTPTLEVRLLPLNWNSRIAVYDP
jgi:hypothetical protein